MMVELMLEFLLATPEVEDEATLRQSVTDLVAHSTGRPTIDQMGYLVAEVVRRGGQAQEAEVYKEIYLARLLARVNQRLAGLRSGRFEPAELTVPGVIEFLAVLRARGITCYLASGTELEAVINEITALGLAHHFEDRIYGPQNGSPPFSKKTVIAQILHDHHLAGCEFVSIGDGKVEITYTAEAGGIGVGVASNEIERHGVNELKREQLVQAGANIVIPDFREGEALLAYLAGVE